MESLRCGGRGEGCEKMMPVCIPAGYWKRQADLWNCLLSLLFT